MAAYIKSKRPGASTASVRGTEESPFFKWLLISVALLFALVFLLLPLINVFAQALSKGWRVYWQALSDPDSIAAIKLTLLVAAISVPLNVLFGLASAWAIAKFSFRGKSLLNTLIDLPFSVSPVVAGLMYVLLFGLQGHFGQWLADHNIKIIFAVPGIVLATRESARGGWNLRRDSASSRAAFGWSQCPCLVPCSPEEPSSGKLGRLSWLHRGASGGNGMLFNVWGVGLSAACGGSGC